MMQETPTGGAENECTPVCVGVVRLVLIFGLMLL